MIRITPEAGTVKTNEARFVVVHPCMIELGFPLFIASKEEGHLFLTVSKSGDVLGPLQGLKNLVRWDRVPVDEGDCVSRYLNSDAITPTVHFKSSAKAERCPSRDDG